VVLCCCDIAASSIAGNVLRQGTLTVNACEVGNWALQAYTGDWKGRVLAPCPCACPNPEGRSMKLFPDWYSKATTGTCRGWVVNPYALFTLSLCHGLMLMYSLPSLYVLSTNANSPPLHIRVLCNNRYSLLDYAYLNHESSTKNLLQRNFHTLVHTTDLLNLYFIS
jgi:hypothetical protein